MNCNKTQKQISAYLDGELSVKDTDAVREHLHGCAACAEVLRQNENIQTAYAAAIPNAPSNFTAQVMERIDREETQAERARLGGFSVWDWLTRPVAQFAAATAAIVAIAGAAFFLFPSQPANNIARNNNTVEPVSIQLQAENLEKAAAVASAFAEGCDGRVLSALKGDTLLVLRIQLPENRVADFRNSVTKEILGDVRAAQSLLAKVAPTREDLVVSLQSTNLGLPRNIILSPLGISTVTIGATRTQTSATVLQQNVPHVPPAHAGDVIVELEIRVSEPK